jgi:hypothetical protein
MGLCQKASNFLADALGRFDPRVQIDVFRRRTSDIKFSSNYDAMDVKTLAGRI